MPDLKITSSKHPKTRMFYETLETMNLAKPYGFIESECLPLLKKQI